MSILSKIKSWTSVGPESLVARTMEQLYNLSVQDAIAEARKWQVAPHYTSFAGECATRLRYLDGSMQSDMEEILKRRFPQTWQALKREQVNIRLYKKLISDQAKVFQNPGEIKLIASDGSMIDSPAFAALLDGLALGTVLPDIDRKLHAIHRLGARPWFDRSARRVRISVWPQHYVFWVLDPDQYWSTDSAHGVLLRVSSEEGIADAISERYEVWAKRKVGETWKTLHYYTGRTKDRWFDKPVSGNDDRAIPYVDPDTGEPIYPITWWRDDNNLEVYWLGDEDALTINRMVNSALTDANNGMHYHTHPIVSWELDPSVNADPPKNFISSPGYTLDIAGIHPRFTAPAVDYSKVLEFWKILIDIESRIETGQASAIVRETGSAESGYALKIRNLPLTEHRNQLAAIYRPCLIDMIRRACIVHNTYARDHGLDEIPLAGNRIIWIPGDIDLPLDPEAEARRHGMLIDRNIESVVEWRMQEYGEDRETALRALEQNALDNRQIASRGANGFSSLGVLSDVGDETED